MKIIEPSVELWENNDSVAHVARCARVCYGKEQGDDKHLYEALIKNKHLSMLRHDTRYFIVKIKDIAIDLKNILKTYNTVRWFSTIVGFNILEYKQTYYIVANGQWIYEHYDEYNLLKDYEVKSEYFSQTEIGFDMMRYTFKVVTQISTSRELNRVSPNNIAERSTRYVSDEGIIVRPHWISSKNIADYYDNSFGNNHITYNYLTSCEKSFDDYKFLINNNIPKEDARGVLPLDTMTVAVYTYTIDEWTNIINLRYYGTTGRPHPNAKIIAGIIREKLIDLGYKL